jgi:hypothetical protein
MLRVGLLRRDVLLDVLADFAGTSDVVDFPTPGFHKIVEMRKDDLRGAVKI